MKYTAGKEDRFESHMVWRQHRNGKTGAALVIKSTNEHFLFWMETEGAKSETVMGVLQILLKRSSNKPVDFAVFPSSYVDLQPLWSETWENKYEYNSLLLYVRD